MLIGICQVELLIPASDNLKSKRFVIRRIKSRISNKFNVSIAEIDHQEKWQHCLLGMALVTNERKVIDRTYAYILNLLDADSDIQVVAFQTEVL